MYCIQCGVELADTEKRCPLCNTRVYHPELQQPAGRPLYPADHYARESRHSKGAAIFLTVVFSVALIFVLLCDVQLHRALTWSPYVLGALMVSYVALALPCWFHRPNPVIFVPCTFAAAMMYLLYIDIATGGGWFLPFAFPVTGCLGLLATAQVTLLRYVPGGKLYIIGGGTIALGGFMLLLEMLLRHAFPGAGAAGWSVYPLAALALLGGFLIFLGICRPAREMMERKFFF